MKKPNDVCTVNCVHAQAVAAAQREMLPEKEVIGLAELFKILGDPTRVRILRALFPGELCVCDLATLLGMSPSAVSHQLRVLRAARLVRYRKQGKVVFYCLDDDHVRALIAEGLDHVRHG
ncbi:transcriptional regulator, ArsR family [Paucidesulfovibrio gracilis DSM 16080]|uniref:Transcriptional regulator, ArsR family n=1 Tax=Paucidesulfovibrio gracilis DSM 16080 TaxID=1121449 RepID=A0A1T4XFE6_9BACT|nr:metalloregulator ArsR/SmtB family transcription factor [Paucidesulfovibrio gracilis]SKA88253.1 transcriptional regulator, ArsR family [Paucidesulfovibrio gracilis DSM 16080]